MKNTNLEAGFLILEDWIPIFREFSARELKEVLMALIDLQKKGTPLPEFSAKRTRMVAGMMGRAIKRRLASSEGGKRSAQVRLGKSGEEENAPEEEHCSEGNSEVGLEVSSEDTSEATSQGSSEQRKEKKKKEEKSKEKYSKGERGSPEATPQAVADVASTAISSAPEVGAELPPPPVCECGKEELDFLQKQGVPPLYLRARWERAVQTASEYGRSPVGVILSWWWQDLAEGAGEKYLGNGVGKERGASYDIDDFFGVALKNTYVREDHPSSS